MAVVVSGTTNDEITALDELKRKAALALAQIDVDLVTLSNTPSNAQVIAILQRTLQNQKKIIRVINRLVE